MNDTASMSTAKGLFPGPIAATCPALVLAACLALVLTACVPEPARSPEALGAPEGFPESRYRELAREGRPLFRSEEARSLVVIEVYRGGSLARMGHDHVLAAHRVQGFVAPDVKRADLYFRLDDLVVDEPELREQAKLATHPSADDIAGTRHNMLKALEAARYPFAIVHAEPNGDGEWRAAFSLHGVTRTQDLPARVELSDDEITVTGKLALKQTDFGIKPVSVLGGALVVVDDVQVSFSIRARRVR